MALRRQYLWLKAVDFVCGIVFGAWLLRLAYPADVRRVFLGILIACCWFFADARRRLFFVRVFRGFLCALVARSWLRRALASAFGLLLITKGTLKALALEYPLFDVGIYHQLLWNLSQGNGFLSSISGAERFLRDHWVPSLYLLTPFYHMASGNSWVLGALPGFIAGLCLAMTFYAWWFLAERFPSVRPKRRAFVSAILILAAWGFQTFYGNLHWGLHENLFGAALLSWALATYFVFSSLNGVRGAMAFSGAVILLVLAAGTKESYLLVAGFTAIGLLIGEKNHSKKAVLGVVATACFWIFVWYAQSDRDPGKNYFTRYYGYLGADLRSMIKTLLFHPLVALRGMPIRQDLRYLWEILMPFGILPAAAFAQRLVTRRVTALDRPSTIALGILPALGSGLLSSHDTLRNPNLHYFFEFIPILGALTLFALFSQPLANSRRLHRWGVAFVLISWITFWAEPWRELYPSVQVVRANVDLIEKLSRIPSGAVVMTQNGVGPWLAARRKAADWGDIAALGGACPEYIVFQANPFSRQEKTQKLADIGLILGLCQRSQASPATKAKLVDSSGQWWIYSVTGK